MAGLGLSNYVPVSKTQQADGQIVAGAPAQSLSSLERSLFQGLRSSGDPSHLPHIDQNLECHGEPMRPSCFTRVGRDVRPFERIPYDADREVAAATVQPRTPVHQPRDLAQVGRDKTRKAQRRLRKKSRPVKHTDQNNHQIQKLEPHLRSLILFHISNTEALQVLALKRILEYRHQHPPIHICRIERRNADLRSMILVVICLLCTSGPEAPSPFKEPNALAKFGHHFRSVHCNIRNPFVCIIPPCNKSFSLRHDMARHVKAAHADFDGATGDIEDDILDPVVAPNAAGPSNTRHASNGSSPVLARHNTLSVPSSISGPNRPVKLYPSQPTASLNQDWDNILHVMQPGSFRIQPANGGAPITTQSSGAGPGPSNSHRAGYMMSPNPPSVAHTSSNQLTMSFLDAHGEPYGGLSHIPASGSNVPADYLPSHAEMTRTLSPFILDGNLGGVASGAPSQIQPRQPGPSTGVAQMALPVNANYPMNATAENRFAQPHQNRMTSTSVQGPRQSMPIRATARAVTQQQRYDPNGTSMSTRRAQALRHKVDYMAIERSLLGEQNYIQPGSQYYNPSTSSQTRHAVSVQQPQPQHPLQNRVDTTLVHQYTAYSPWELPQASLNMGSWAFMDPSLDPRSPRASPNNRGRANPPQRPGYNVSPDWKTLKGEVARKLPLWLRLIGLMVGVSEAVLSVILVFLDPPRERKGCNASF